MSDRELTTAETSERLNVAERTVRLWCQQGRFPNARPEETPFGAYWKIPESDLKDFEPPKMGRPRKEPQATPAKKARRKGAK